MAKPNPKIQEIEDMNDFSQQMDLISNRSLILLINYQLTTQKILRVS